MEKDYLIEPSENQLLLRNSESGEAVSSIAYTIKENPHKYLNISIMGSKEKRQGHFSTLYKALESIATENECKSIRLKTGTDSGHGNVRDMMTRRGYSFLPQTSMDASRGRVEMEKLLKD